ncbi:RDD family protein [Foetidibacter luteolus]|uniref:RDD family protein n=1 Tax=Foetidibacter luteolus TaxID=2608880 RepID=UPI00129AFF4E|nr:RDD family protein [Foetidibacter luteolus]
MKKIISPKFIFLFSMLVSLAWLILSITSLFIKLYSPSELTIASFLDFLATPIDIRFLASFGLDYICTTTHTRISSLSLWFYFLLLIGSFTYQISQYKSFKILKFCFSCIIMYSVVDIIVLIYKVTGVINPVFNDQHYFLMIFSLLKMVGWGWLSWKILSFFKIKPVIPADTEEPNNMPSNHYVDTTRWQRFAHFIIDTVLAFFTCWPIFLYLVLDLQDSSNNSIGERSLLFLTIVTSTSIYYLFFESLFGTTPGKLLTGSKVIDENDKKPSLKTIILRTLIRAIPFEALSGFTYLWHDTWSKTYVITEKNNEATKTILLFLLSAACVAAVLIYIKTSETIL